MEKSPARRKSVEVGRECAVLSEVHFVLHEQW